MGVYKKLYNFYLCFFVLFCSFSWAQLTDIHIDEVRVNGSLAPHEVCQGEVPVFEIRFRLKVGSSTLTLSATSTLEFTAIGSGGNVFTKTVTNVTNTLDGGNIITSSGAEAYRWPVVGSDAINLSNAGLTNVIFKISLNSVGFSDPDDPDSAVSSTTTINVKAKPPAVSLSTSIGAFDGARNISICSGNDLVVQADTGYTHYEFYRRVNGLAVFSSLGVSTSSSATINNINGAGEDIKVRTYNGLDCYQDSLIYSISVSPTTTVSLNDNLTGHTTCEGDNVIFSAIGSGNWYQFIRVTGGVTSTVQSSTSATYSSTSLSDQDTVLVRNFTSSLTTCYSEKSITVRLNTFSGTSSITGNQSICANSTPTILTDISESTADRSGDGASTSYYWEKNTGTGWTGVGASNSKNYQPPALTQTTAYRRVLQSSFNTKACLSSSNVVTITVNALPVAGLSGTGLTSSTICFGDKPVFSATPSSGVSYTFYISGVPVEAAAVSGSIFNSVSTTLNLFNGAIIGVRITNPSGCSDTESITLFVNKISGSDIVTTTTVSYCTNADPAIITHLGASSPDNGGSVAYKWQTRTSSPVASAYIDINVPSATALNYDPPPLPDGTHHFRRLTINTLNSKSCTATPSNEIVITVGDGSAPTLTVTLTNTSTSQTVTNNTVCVGDGIDFDATSSSGNGYEFKLNGAAVQGPSADGTLTINSFSDGDLILIRVYENSDGTGCFSDFNAPIRVNSITGNNTISSGPQTICSLGDPVEITSLSSPTHDLIGGSVVFKWQQRSQGTIVWSDISGANTKNYNPLSGQLTSTTEFRRLAIASFSSVECSGNTSPTFVSNIHVVNVVPSFTATLTSSPNPAELCEGEPFTITAAAVPGASYEFLVNDVSQGAASASRTLVKTLTNGQEVKVIVTSGACSITSNPLTVIVNSDPIPIIVAPGVTNGILCEGSLPTLEGLPAAGVTHTFYLDGIEAPPAAITGNKLDLSQVVLSDVTRIDLKVTNLVNGCSDTTTTTNGSSLILTLNKLSGFNNINTATVSYCSGADPVSINSANIPTSSIGATLNYSWEKRTLPATWGVVASASSSSFNPLASIGDGVHEFRRLITATVSSVSCSPTSSIYFSNTVTITIGAGVGSSPPVTLTSNNSPTLSNIICEGDDLIFTATSNSSATFYEFFVGNVSQGIQASPTNTFDTSTASVSLVDNTEVRVRVYTGVDTGTGCFNDDVITLRVNSMSNGNIIAYTGSNPICNGDNPPAINGTTNPTSTLAADGGTIVYEWERDIGDGSGFVGILSTDSPNYDPTNPTVTTAYRRKARASFSGDLCEKPSIIHISNVVTITVQAGPAPLASLSSGLTSNTICAGTNSITLDASLSSNANSYLFFVNGNPINSHPAANSTYTSTATILDGFVYKVRAYAGAGRTGCFDEADFTITLNTVSGTNQIGPNVQNICRVSDIQMINSLQTPTGSGTITYRWEIRPAATGNWSEIVGADAATLTPTLDGISSAYRRSFRSDLNGQICNLYSNVVTVTLNAGTIPTAVLDSNMPSHTVCQSDTGQIIFEADADANATRFDFYFNGNLVQSDAADRTFDRAILGIIHNDRVTVRVYNASGCYDEDELFVQVNALYAGTVSGSTSVCENSPDIVLLTNVDAGRINGVAAVNGDYQWQYSTDDTNWSDIIVNGNNATYAVPPNPSPPNKYYRRLVKNTMNTVSCTIPTASVLITVTPLPSPSITNNITGAATSVTICATDTSLIFQGSGGESFEFLINGSVQYTTNASLGLNTANFDIISENATITNGDVVSVKVYNKPLVAGNPDPTACSSTSIEVYVGILGEPNATLSSDKDVICDDESFILTATAGGIAGATYRFSINDALLSTVTATATQTSVNFSPSAPFTSSMTVKVDITTPQGCTAVATITILENIITPGTITGSQTICSGRAPSPIISATTPTVSSGATVTYQWHSSIDNFVSFNLIGVNSPTYSPPNLLQTTRYRRIDFSNLNGKTCSSTTNEITITVNNGPGGDLWMNNNGVNSSVATRTICDGDDPIFTIAGGSGKSYQWRIDGIVESATNTNTFKLSDVGKVFSGIDIVDVIVYDLPLTGGGGIDPLACKSTTQSITVTTVAAVNPVLVSDATNNTFCTGENVIFTVTSPLAGVTSYRFTRNGGVLIQPVGPSNTASVSNLVNNELITVQLTMATGCTAVATLTMVENAITPGTISGTQSICSGATPALITNVSSPTVAAGATITYQWHSSTAFDGFATFSVISLSNSETYQPGGITQNTQFRRVEIVELNSKTCSTTTAPITISINNGPGGNLWMNISGVNSSTATRTICSGDTAILTTQGDGYTGANRSYKWMVSGVQEALTNTPTLNYSSFVGVQPIFVEIYDKPLTASGTLDPLACKSTTQSITVTTVGATLINLISDATNRTFCDGQNVTFEATAIASATYRFFVDGALRRPDSSSNTFSINNLANNSNVRVVVTLDSGCTATTSMSMIKNDIITAGTISGTQVICFNTVPNQITSLTTATEASGTATITYRWESSTDNISYNDTGSVGETYTSGPLAQTTFFKRVAISTLNNVTCESETVPPVQITVIASLNGGTILPANDQVLCFGLAVRPATLTVTGSLSGVGITYQWQSSPNGINGWVDIGPEQGPSFTPPTLTSTATLYYRRVTKANGGGPNCEEVSDVHTININDTDPGIIDVNSVRTYCYGTNPPSINSTSEAVSSFGATSYQWQKRTTGLWTDITSATGNSYDPSPLTETTIFKRIVSSTRSGTTCLASTNEVRITILPELDSGTVLANQNICEDTQPLDITLATTSIGAGITYQWEKSLDNESWSELAGQNSLTLPFTGVETITSYYRAVITSAVNTPTTPIPNQQQISLTRTANPLNVGETYFIYIGTGTYSLTTTGATSDTDSIGNGLALDLTNNAPGITASYASDVDIISIFPLQNDISISVSSTTAAHNMRILSAITGEGCKLVTDSVKITVNPASTLVQTGGQSGTTDNLCTGDVIGIGGDKDPIRFKIGGGAISMLIENLNTAYTPTATGVGTVTAIGGGNFRVTGTDEVVITGTAGPTDFFTVRSEGSGCAEVLINYSIRVSPAAIAPDVIMKDQNSIYNAIISNGGKWYNNTVCQDRPDIGGGGETLNTDFYACFIDQNFNALYQSFDWKIEPDTAGAKIIEQIQTALITLTSGTATLSPTVNYTITVNGRAWTAATASPAVNDIDELGAALRARVNLDPEVDATYDSDTNTLRIFAENPRPPAPIITFSRTNPTSVGDNATMSLPNISISTAKMTVDWDPLFSGTVTVSVRTTGCGTPSAYFNAVVEVVPETIPVSNTSDLIAPDAIPTTLCNGFSTGSKPVCSVTGFRRTQFFTSSDNTTNDYGSLLWEISAVGAPGDPSITSPGTIDQRGVVTWNIGYIGDYEIKATPISCDSVTGTTVISTYTIGPRESTIPTVIPIGGIAALPTCPIPAAGIVTTTLRVPDFPVRWFISDLNSIRTGGGANQNTVTNIASRELQADAGTDDKELTLYYAANYSGAIVLSIIPRDCPSANSTRRYPIIIPDAAEINLLSNPTTANQIVCPNQTITDIEYVLRGAATGVVSQASMNLPNGITVETEYFIQTTTITLSNSGLGIGAGRDYIASIDEVYYTYTVQAGDNLDDIGNGISASVSGAVSSSYNAATNVLTLQGNITGKRFSTVILPPRNNIGDLINGVNFSAPSATDVLRKITLKGAASVTSGTFLYTLTTTSTNVSCTVDSINGMITVQKDTTVTLTSGNVSQTVCDGNLMTDIVYTIENSSSVDLVSLRPLLPNGIDVSVTPNATGATLRIFGTPAVNPANPQVFTYTISTTANVNGCSESNDTIGSITVTPSPIVAVVTATLLNQIDLCAFEPILDIEFTVSNPAFGMQFVPAGTNLPDGVSGTLTTRNQETEVTFGGGAAAVTGTLVINLSGVGETHSVNAGVGSTTDQVGAAFATSIDSSPRYSAAYATPVLTIRAAAVGPFTTILDTDGTGITMTQVMTVSPALFTISGTPSVTLLAPTVYTFEVQATGPSCTGTDTIKGTLTVRPATSGSLDTGFGSNEQTVCDNTAIQQIRYNTIGVPGLANIIPNGGNPAWLNHSFDAVAQVLTVTGSPTVGNLQQQSFDYSFTLTGAGFPCVGNSTPTVSGVITVNPAEQLVLTSGAGTDSQTICVDRPIIDIVYEFRGSANAAAFASPIGIPPGVTGTYLPRQQISEITLSAGVAVASETYFIYLNGTPYNASIVLGNNEDVLGPLLAAQLDGDADVSATYNAGTNKIIITANVAGKSFGLYIPSSTNTIRLGRPILATSPGIYRIKGTPSGIISGTYNYTLSTPGTSCDADTQVGTIVVTSKSSITLASNNDNQEVCDGDTFNDMVYNLSGGVRGVTATGLPNGLNISLDDPFNPTTAVVTGTPNTGDTARTIYNFTLTTTANENGCDETTVSGSVIIQPVDTLTLSSTIATSNQSICVGDAIAPLIYEFGGGANGANTTGLPPGVTDTFTQRKQVSSILITGPNVAANESYIVYVDNQANTVTSTAGDGPVQIATKLRTLINAQSTVVSATGIGGNLILTAVNEGLAFSVRSTKGSVPPAQLTFNKPVLKNGTYTLSITGTPTADAITGGSSTTYNITVTTVNANGCTNAIELPRIKVNPQSTVSITTVSTTLNQTLCVNNDIIGIGFTIGGGATNAIDSGLPLGVSVNNIGGNNFRITGKPTVAITVPTTYSYTVTTTGNPEGCEEASFSGTIIVNPDDGVTLNPGSNNIQTVCEGDTSALSAITTITYTLSGGAQSASISGLPPGIKTSYNPGTRQYTIFGIPTVTITSTTDYNYSITTSGACVSKTLTGLIKVQPKAKLEINTATSTLNQTVCDNTVIDNIGFNLVGSTVNATGSGFPTGVGLDPVVGNTITISGTPVVNVVTPTTYSFTVTATGDGSGCEEQVITGTILVLPDDGLTLTSAAGTNDQSLCVGTNPTISSLTTITYQISGGALSANIVGLPPGFNSSYNATTKVYSIFGTAISDVVSNPTVFNYTVTTSGTCAAVTEVGKITITPKAKITVTTATTTLDQTVCENGTITNITFDLSGSSTNASGAGFPAGVGLGPLVGNTITISGDANVNVSTPTIYTFTVTATGNGTCEEETFTGQIEVLPNDELTHISGGKNQTICNGNDPANTDITPIVFQLGGGANTAVVTGLPSGMTFTYSPTTKRVTISGTTSVSITVPTDYTYTVTTIGTCSDTTDNGTITVNPLSTLVLTSSASTTQQINDDGKCDDSNGKGEDIDQITYTFGGGATSFIASGLPNGVNAVQVGANGISITGKPNTGDTFTRIWDYTITTAGNPCSPEVTLRGKIQVNPSPQINRSFIQITEISCYNADDGKLEVPADIVSAISGGQNSNQVQIDQLTVSGTFKIDDRVRVRINGTQYEYFVKGSVFNAGVAENNNAIASGLAQLINNNIPSEVPITALAAAANIRLTSDTAGVPFTITYPAPRVQTTLTGTITNTSITLNQTLNYNIQWTGTGIGVPQSTLILSNLGPGDYVLEVTVDGNCSATESFTLTEPDELTIANPIACDGIITGQASGGTKPYSYLVKNFTTGNDFGPFTRNGALTVQAPQIIVNPNDSFRIDVTDAKGCVKQSAVFTMPDGLLYTPANTRVVDDFCFESPTNLGGGSIELQTTAGLAFTGGSGLFTYSWSGPNSYTNSTMNIKNLLPGAYQVTAIDQLFGCQENANFTINPADPLIVLPTAGTDPAPAGVSSATDYLVSITCPGEAFTLEVQAQGGGGAAYTYTFSRAGTVISSGNDNRLTSTTAGIYTVGVSVNTTDPNLIPFGESAPLSCTASISFEVREPTVMTVREIKDKRFVPACSDDFASLTFEVVGGNTNGSPYTLSLEGGSLTGVSGGTNPREITISGIDTNLINEFSTYEITDANGCVAASSLTSSITLPVYENVSFQVNPFEIDCANSQDGSIELVLANGTPNLSQIGVQISSNALSYNYFSNWNSANTGSQANSISIDIKNAGVYKYKIIGTPSAGTSNTTSSNTTYCELDSGTVEVKEADSNQILLRDIETIQPGCNQTGGTIKLVFDENTLPPTMSIAWQKLTFVTTSVTTAATSSTSPTTQTISSQQWRSIPALANNIELSDLENGTYRSVITPGTGGTCGSEDIVTRSLTVGSNSGLRILNPGFVESGGSVCTNPTSLRYDVKFLLENNLPSSAGNAFQVTLNKVSDYGDAFSTTFAAGSSVGISRPLTGNGSGNYTISNAPFGEYQLIVSQVTTATTDVCEVTQVIIIPEVQPLEYTGAMEYVLDVCTQEVEITADVQGGVPFISSNGDSFYQFLWTLDLGGGASVNYSGKTIIVTEPGNLSLTISDASGCSTSAASGTSIEIKSGLSPYRVLPKLVSNTLFAEEPSCQNAARDDGKISFEVLGGINDSGVQWPYEIKWEKYDVGSTAYLEMDGTNGLPKISDQSFAFNLIPGQYKISVAPMNWTCTGVSPYSTVGLVKYITVPANEDLAITNGPFIVPSEYDFITPGVITICDVGGAGDLYLDVFDNYDGDLEFYYPDEITLLGTVSKIDDKTYKLGIVSSVASGTLTVVNSVGCRISASVMLEIGQPNFDYTSANAQISGSSSSSSTPLILAREDVTFTNTSTGTFTYLEWDFGDGSPVKRVFPLSGSTSPVTHEYGISGTYYAKLRLYNSVGCYEETIKEIIVGKGYNILVPNVFTPNGDRSPLENETFVPLFSGFKYIQMSIYDYRGNLIFMSEAPDASAAAPVPGALPTPLVLTGWNGDVVSDSPYYIYSIFGQTTYGDVEVTKSGTFIIIR